MQRILIVAALLVCLMHPPIAQDVIGDWQGTLRVGSVELRLVLHIGRESSVAFKATLDSFDQGMNGIPITLMSLSQSQLKFTVESVNASYEGTLNAAATTVSGTRAEVRIPSYTVHGIMSSSGSCRAFYAKAPQ